MDPSGPQLHSGLAPDSTARSVAAQVQGAREVDSKQWQLQRTPAPRGADVISVASSSPEHDDQWPGLLAALATSAASHTHTAAPPPQMASLVPQLTLAASAPYRVDPKLKNDQLAQIKSLFVQVRFLREADVCPSTVAVFGHRLLLQLSRANRT